MPNPRIFFDFSLDNAPIGRVIFELFADQAPKTCENFRALATGERGVSRISQVPLYYKGSIVHRSIKGFMIQGGDFTQRNGKGGESIYGAPFPDEDLSRPLDAEGLLAMANKGPNTNGSQWFITLSPCPHLNGKHVVFGRVIRGFAETIQKIVAVQTDERDRPSVPVVITHCGELELRKPQSAAKVVKESSEVSASVAASSDEETRKKTKSHTKRRPRSHSQSSHADSAERSPRKTKKHKKEKSKKRSGDKSLPSAEPHKETEEEYDARLEREENERLEEQRRLELAKVKERLQRHDREGTQDGSGIRYKGRGRMKYTDPERSNYRNYQD